MVSELIYAISEIDKEILAIEREINKKVVLEKLFSLRDEYNQIKDKYEKLFLESEKNSKAILDLTEKNEDLIKELKELEEKLYNSSNVKSIEIMQHSLDKLTNEIQSNENVIYAYLEEQEKDKISRNEYKNKLNSLSSSYNSMRKEYQDHVSALKQSISSLKEKRASIVSSLDVNLVNEYESIKSNKGYGMSILKGETCTGCGMSVPYIIITNARRHDTLQKCPNCGRFIYISD